MKDRISKKEVTSQYGNSDMIVDLRSLLAEKKEIAEKKLQAERLKNEAKNKLSFAKLFKKNKSVLLKKKTPKKGPVLAIAKKEKPTKKERPVKRERAVKKNKERIKAIKKKVESPVIGAVTESSSFEDFFNKNKRRERKKQTLKLFKVRKEFLRNKFSHFLQVPSLEFKKKTKRKKKFFSFPNLPGFLLVLLLIIIPLKLMSSLGFLDFKNIENKVFNNSYKAIDNFVSASDSIANLNFKEADLNFNQAALNLLAAEDELGKINNSLLSLAALSSDPKLKLASQSKKFLAAGISASSLAQSLLAASDSLLANSDDFNESLDLFIANMSLSLKEATKLKAILKDINSEALPLEYQVKLKDLKKQINFLVESLDEFVRLGDKFKDVLGLSIDKRYLLVFQNNAEIRASGGFLGSYALVDIRDGKIRNLEVPAGGSYDLEAGLQGKKFASPYPLHLVNPLWNFWDANWWPSWPKTARHLMWFYEQSSGPSVDGVISLTPNVVENLLKITGEIDMTEEYGLIIDSDNFWETVQKVVEYKNLELSHPESLEGIASSSKLISVDIPLSQDLDNNPDNKPKKIIGDLMARLLEVLPEKMTVENLPAMISLITDSVSEKHILFYFKDEKLQDEIVNYGLAGELKDYDHDYLLIVDSNIAGQKTDKIMRQEVSLLSEQGASGEIVNSLIIDRHHPGERNQALTGVRNVNWLRVYVPLGSELISFTGFSKPDQAYFDDYDPDAVLLEDLKNEREALVDKDSGTFVYNEDGRTVFANWTMTDPGHITRVDIKYRLPFNFNDIKKSNDSWLQKAYYYLNPKVQETLPYSLIVQKQAGAKSFPLRYQFRMRNNYETTWSSENNDLLNKNYLFNLITEINRDRFFGALLKKKI